VTSQRQYPLALGLIGLGSGLALVAGGAVWVRASAADPGLPAVRLDLTGYQLAPAVLALGLVSLAGVVAVVATRGVGRRAAGTLLLVAGAGQGVTAAGVGLRPDAAAAGPLAARLASGAPAQPLLDPTGWWLATVLGGALVVAGAALVVVRGGSWPGLSRRFEGTATRPVRPGDAWAALDRGEDPTADRPDLPE